MKYLFADKNGDAYTVNDVYIALRDIGANDCEALFIHSDLLFGSASEDFDRKEYVAGFYESIMRLDVRYIIVPTFTFSFCNNVPFDIKKSRSYMGTFSEFIRKCPHRYRTSDPILSISVPTELRSKFEHVGNHSLGTSSGFDVLHYMQNVKFLFLGAQLHDCFTYLHYVEKILDVPYRYDQPFTGTIIDENGNRRQRTQYIHTACKGVRLREDTRFEDYLTEQGFLRKVPLGNSYVSCISETDAYREIVSAIEKDPMYFLAEPYCKEDLRREYTYDLSAGRITHC